ncbi:MAG: hypothetical protein J7499_14240 [Sphingopyxis sp.]|nr:hypothetical protein [Sphingopyxis sp.]
MLTLILSLALSAAAPEAAETPAPAATPAKPAKPKKICRTDVNTGSRLKGRTCKTQEQWDAQPQDIGSDVRINGGASAR